MAADNRDWYRDWWRKKTGYVERARFRVSEGEFQHQKWAGAWRRNFIVAAAVVGVLVLLKIAL